MAAPGEVIDDVVLSATKLPCLIFVGGNDDRYSWAQEASQILPNAAFFSLPGLDHIDAHHRIDLVIPAITEFLSDVIQS